MSLSKLINIKFIIFFLVSVNILLSAYFLLHGDIHYDRDVARDFLVIDDIIRNKNLTLLGPRSSIPGLFHGPLWFYVNLPAFFIGGGNPLVLGWFWLGLSIIFLLIVYKVAKELFGSEVALIAVLLLSVNSIVNPSVGLKNFYNPYGAVFLSPLLFLFLYRYLVSFKAKHLLLALFITGLIIQFQLAFGIPILLAETFLLIYILFRKRLFTHFLSFLILIIPLSTFVLFDFRHNFLQFKTISQYFTQMGSMSLGFNELIIARLRALVFDFFEMLFVGKNLLTIIYTTLFLIGTILILPRKSFPKRKIHFLFWYLLLVFWLISLIYQGELGNYFWPFLPLLVIIVCSFYGFLNKKLFIIVFVVLYLANLHVGLSAISSFETDVNKRGPHSWAFNLEVAKKIYTDAKEDFGYFNYSPDRYAYQQRYAMIYAKKFFPEINSFSSIKKPLTYLIEVDPPKDRPELSSTAWRISDIGIERVADQTFRFDFIQVEKYFLSEEEIRIPTNPLILDYMFIR